MGLVLDSGVLIGAERNAKPVSELLATLEQEHGETEILLSSITVMELEHGFHRANTARIGAKATGLFGHHFRCDSRRAVYQSDGSGCGKDRRRSETERGCHPFARPAHRCYRSSLWVCNRHAESTPLRDDSRPKSPSALVPPQAISIAEFKER